MRTGAVNYNQDETKREEAEPNHPDRPAASELRFMREVVYGWIAPKRNSAEVLLTDTQAVCKTGEGCAETKGGGEVKLFIVMLASVFLTLAVFS